jgi:DNA-binding HxlR family transcriptional regulator
MVPESHIDIDRRFRELTLQAEAFSREFAAHAGPIFLRDPRRSAVITGEITKTIFGKWSMEILSLLYFYKSLGFGEIRKDLRGISSRILSQKLRLLEERKLLSRVVLPTRPARVRYSLTADGVAVVKLGEPVLLFLRYRDQVGERLKTS